MFTKKVFFFLVDGCKIPGSNWREKNIIQKKYKCCTKKDITKTDKFYYNHSTRVNETNYERTVVSINYKQLK